MGVSAGAEDGDQASSPNYYVGKKWLLKVYRMQNSWEEWRERNPGDCSGVHKRQMHCPPAGRPLAQDDTLACLSRLGELAPLLLAGAEGERHGPAYACHNTNKVGSHSDRNPSIEVRASRASCPG